LSSATSHSAACSTWASFPSRFMTAHSACVATISTGAAPEGDHCEGEDELAHELIISTVLVSWILRSGLARRVETGDVAAPVVVEKL
jgi:hypothetical protein